MNKQLIECTIKAIEEVPTLGRTDINKKCALYYLAQCAGITDLNDYEAIGEALGNPRAFTLIWETNDWTTEDSPKRPKAPIGNKQGVLDLLRSWL